MQAKTLQTFLQTLGPFIREKISRGGSYLYEYKLPGQDKPRLEKAVNADFVPFIRGVLGLRKPRPELATAYFISYKRPYCYRLRMPNVYSTTCVTYMYCTLSILLVVQPCCFKNASEAYTRIVFYGHSQQEEMH